MDSRLAEHPERDVVRADLLNDLGFTRPLESGGSFAATFDSNRQESTSAEFQAEDPVDLGAFGGKHDDARTGVRRVCPDSLAHLETIYLGHHHVQENEVRFFLLNDFQCLRTVFGK